jgi:hypothetical protein
MSIYKIFILLAFSCLHLWIPPIVDADNGTKTDAGPYAVHSSRYLTRAEFDKYRNLFLDFDNNTWSDGQKQWLLLGPDHFLTKDLPTPAESRFGFRLSREEVLDPFTGQDLFTADYEKGLESIQGWHFDQAFKDLGGRVEFWFRLWEF